MEIKICGLTGIEEAEYLNDAQVDYAGFVFFEKSKRNVTIEQAVSIKKHLNPQIRSVAVTVSPDAALAAAIEDAGFDILQVHKHLAPEVIEQIRIPVWYAFNVSDAREISENRQLSDKIEAIVVDGARYGSGETFDWNSAGVRQNPVFQNRKFILAGGLNPQNVAEGIRIFHPDIIDVSSGVEGAAGKDRMKIEAFVRAARA
jgi:phosphoribosylanthranilate isomerase